MSKSGYWYVAGAISCVVAVSFVAVTNKRKSHTVITVAGRAPVRPRQRRTYPYSVISGGVESGAELRTALLTDPVAAEHYGGFHVERTEAIQLTRPRRVYVSYRKGDRIYWTRNRLTLPKGETLLTDGNLSARTRCGNRLSDTPQSPVLQKEEPSPKEFEEVLELEASPPRWNEENWQETVNTTPGESKAPGSTVAKDYQASFGPDLSRTGGALGGGGGGGGYLPSGGGQTQNGATGSTVPTSVTTGGSSSGLTFPVSGNFGVPPPTTVLPPTPPSSVSYPPISGGQTNGVTTPSLPSVPLWAPVAYSFPDFPPIVLANSYPPTNMNPTFAPLPTGDSHANGVTFTVFPSGSDSLQSTTHDETPVSESPEPDTLALMLAAGIISYASSGARRRLRNPKTEM